MEFLENSMPNTMASVNTPLAVVSSKPLSTPNILGSNTPPPPPPLATITSPPPTPITTACIDDYFSTFPPGYRFCPRDAELVVDYLARKVKGLPLPRNKIVDLVLYQHNPDYLAEKYKRYGENEFYFFTPRYRKYRNGSRPDRAADGGYWKATGKDAEVKYKDILVGHRKTLDFYRGKAPQGEKTAWKMHEFKVNDPAPNHQVRNEINDMRLDDWVLCKIYKKNKATNSSNRQRIEENSTMTAMDNADYINHHDEEYEDTNDLPVMDAGYVGEIDNVGADALENGEIDNVGADALENAFPFDDYSLQQIALSESPAASYSSMFQDILLPSLAETCGDPVLMFSDSDNWSSQYENLNPINLFHCNTDELFFDLHTSMPINLPNHVLPPGNLANPAPPRKLPATNLVPPPRCLPLVCPSPPPGYVTPANPANNQSTSAADVMPKKFHR